ncbi:GtrA family protein [Actinacidiphila glaucinigra]|uniref:GtrA family protein n=1 Tax=Actinacidiphila glaucinigra TaxID=235986 RepID=UPI0035DCECED
MPTALRQGVRQILVFSAIGAASTMAYLALYAALRFLAPSQLANMAALLITSLVNTAANRRFTFRITGAQDLVRHQFQGGVAFLATLGLSSGALALLDSIAVHTSRLTESLVLLTANAAATLMRFLLLRTWVFRGPG